VFVALKEDGQLDDEKGPLQSKKSAMWHLLLWSVLSYKPAMTHFFVLHTAAPLGRPTILIIVMFPVACQANADKLGARKYSLLIY